MNKYLTVFMTVFMVGAVSAQEPAAEPENAAETAVEQTVVPAAAETAAEGAASSETVVQQETAEPAPCHVPAKGVALIAAGAVEPDLVDRVQKYVQSELFTKVTVLDPVETAVGGFDEQVETAVAKKTDDHLAVMVLASLEGNTHHGASYPDQGVAVINVAALRPDPMDAELYGRRVEKQLMSAGGILLGMEICPNPLCALSAYDTMERLDAKGRNFCPPCQDRVKKILAGKDALLEPVPAE